MNVFGAKFEGRIDRIEQRGDSVVILDYKTGIPQNKNLISIDKLDLNIRETWSQAIPSLQLPMYLLLYGKHTGIPTEQIVPAYLYLGESRLSKESEKVFIEVPAERASCFLQIQKMIIIFAIIMNIVLF